MKLLPALALFAALAALADAQSSVAPGAKKPCLEAGGAAIQLNGNFGFCYLKGRRMRHGSVFAQCADGVLSCYEDEGIPDKPRKKIPCIAPEPGFCGSSKDATPAPTPTPSAAANATADGNSTRLVDVEVGDENDDEEDDEEEEEEETRDIKPHTVNPSALVAGNLPNGETYEDEEDEDDDDGVY